MAVFWQTMMKQGGTLMPVAIEGLQSHLQTEGESEGVEFLAPLPRPFFGMSLRMFSQRSRNIGISLPGMFSATGTRVSLTMPHSMASMREKSLIVQGNKVPSG